MKQINEFITAGIAACRHLHNFGLPPYPFKLAIRGVTYDSTKMECVAVYNNADEVEDYAYVEETLYRTSSGDFLLVGVGAVNTPWSRRHELRAERITAHATLPLSAEQAREWLELRQQFDALFEVFGESEDDGLEVMLRLPASVAMDVREASRRLDVSVEEFIRDAVEREVKAAQ